MRNTLWDDTLLCFDCERPLSVGGDWEPVMHTRYWQDGSERNHVRLCGECIDAIYAAHAGDNNVEELVMSAVG